MIEMLQYGFMQRAFITGILLAVIAPLIGITIVLKRMSMIGDALSHASLAGVALGLLLGINPILGARGSVCLQPWESKGSEERFQDILRWRYRSSCQQGSDLLVFYPDS